MLKRVIIFFSVIIALVILSIYQPYLTGERQFSYELESCFVNRILDGDTLVCNNQTIRLLGINTPEKGEEFYQQAKDYLSEVNNKEVQVLRDWNNKDKYNRDLRYIFYQDRFINVEIVENGLAIAFMTEKLKYEDKFLNAEQFAKNNCLGLWEEDCNK